MRKKMVAGNWKMNLDVVSGEDLISELVDEVSSVEDVDIVIIPPYILLDRANKLIENTFILLGAQEVSYNQKGAFTGEISISMLKSVGCHYVLIGHSERRQYHNETDELVNKRLSTVLDSGLLPIVCVGESLDEREKGLQENIVKQQVEKGLADVSSDEIKNVILAYEPVWAIGTGKTASPAQAQEMHQYIRNLIETQFGKDIANGIRILYGGSVKPQNADELFMQPDIDGGLIGGACLKSDSFVSIIKSAI